MASSGSAGEAVLGGQGRDSREPAMLGVTELVEMSHEALVVLSEEELAGREAALEDEFCSSIGCQIQIPSFHFPESDVQKKVVSNRFVFETITFEHRFLET